MQIVVEGLALYTFRDMRVTTQEPLLKQLLTYVSQDEARHTAYGIKYLGAVVPTLDDKKRAELEDFAFDAACMLLDSRRGQTLSDAFRTMLEGSGLDPNEVGRALAEDADRMRAAVEKRGGRLGPVSGFVIPTLRKIGLYSERVDARFREMFEANQIRLPADADGLRKNPLDALVSLPEDLEAWVLQEA
jgi:hypothetical protein